MRIQRRVDKAHSRLAFCQTLEVDSSNERGENWRRGGSATDQGRGAFVVDYDVVAYGADVGVALERGESVLCCGILVWLD
jgi:hypothetical protein